MAGKHKTRSLKWVCHRKTRMTSENSHSKMMWNLIEKKIALGEIQNSRVVINETGIYSIHYSRFITDDGGQLRNE